MKPIDIDSPIRLDLPFWIIYVLVGLPCLSFIRLFLSTEPLITRVAGYILLPFLIAIVVYTVALFVAALFTGGPTQKRKFMAFLITIGVLSIAFGFEWAISGFKNRGWYLPGAGSFFAILIYGALSRRK